MYILVLEDVIGSDVGDGFYWPTLYIASSAMYSSSFSCSEFLQLRISQTLWVKICTLASHLFPKRFFWCHQVCLWQWHDTMCLKSSTVHVRTFSAQFVNKLSLLDVNSLTSDTMSIFRRSVYTQKVTTKSMLCANAES